MRKLQKSFSRSRAHSKTSTYSGNRDSIDIEADSHSRPVSAQAPEPPNDSPLPNHQIANGLMNGQQQNGLFKLSPATQRSSRHTPSNSISGLKSGPPSSSLNPSIHGTPAGTPNGNRNAAGANSSGIGRMPSTIRPVRSFDASDSSCDSPSARNSDFSSSTNSAASHTSYASQSQRNGDSTPTVRLKPTPQQAAATPERPIPSAPSSTARGENSQGPEARRDNFSSPKNAAEAEENHDGQGHWDSSVGKAGLGKTGRVINKLVSDNEALKRDIKIEKLKAEEAKQAAKLLEDKMSRMEEEYHARSLDGQVTKTLLSRKERQVDMLKAQVEQEKQKAIRALAREKNWRDEMEQSQQDATRRVEDAENKAMMFEGRYSAISSHWRDQGDEVQRATSKLRKDMADIVEERRKDDEKIAVLRDLCDQQDSNIRELADQKEAITRQFEAYKVEQEQSLQDIKTKAQETEEEQARMLAEAKEVLDKLKWALNINKIGIGGSSGG